MSKRDVRNEQKKKIWENESHLFFSSLLSQEQLQKLLFFLFEIFT